MRRSRKLQRSYVYQRINNNRVLYENWRDDRITKIAIKHPESNIVRIIEDIDEKYPIPNKYVNTVMYKESYPTPSLKKDKLLKSYDENLKNRGKL